LVALLIDLEPVPAAPHAAVSSGMAAEPAAAPLTAAPEPEPTAPVAEPISFDDPYVASALCTTCNECTNLNPRMFVYNANRQATIADPSAGTFEELVKAAEKCPARCIHPGTPRDGDPTVDERLLARAKAFA
ncbi:MAG TPA: ferredoxin, partial [Candidatus Polarisedimenticolaceae bacterium]|nr:ferredoxin [Candidatus Polarisedimenticolaceae bacterium]